MDKFKKICFVEINPFPEYSGGIETWLYNITKILSQKNYQILILSPKRIDFVKPFFDISEFKNVKLHRLPAIDKINSLFKKHLHYSFRILFTTLEYLIWTLLSTFQLIFLRQKLSNAPIIVLGPVPAISPVLLARPFLKNVKIVGSVRGRYGDNLKEKTKNTIVSALFKRIEMGYLKKCSLVLANGYDTQQYLERGGVASEVLPNGVDFLKFAKPTPATFKNEQLLKLERIKNGDIKIIMMTATLSDIRGIKYLIQAAPLIKKAVPNFKIIFVGKGDLKEYIELAREIDVEDKIEFVGQQTEINHFLELADVVACLTIGGGISHSLLEAMASGRPIVAWDVDTYSQILKDNYSALLASGGDEKNLAQKITSLLEDKNWAENLGKNAQREAQNYDWPVITEKFIKFLTDIL